MAEFTEQVPFFLRSFLQKPASSIPKGSQWVVQFDDILTEIFDAIKLALKNEPESWMIDRAFTILNSKEYQETKGCLFANAIRIPGESMTVTTEGTNYNGLIRSYVGGGRNAFPEMSMTFLETNVSFVDNVVRPWVLATAAFGLIARKKPQKYRTNLTCYKLGVTRPGETPSVLMKITFKDICAISVSDEGYEYTTATGAINREAKFIYNHYHIDTQTENSFMINNISELNTPQFGGD